MTRPTREHFEQLVRDHHAAVYRSALRRVADAEVAADVTQDVFVRVAAGKVRWAAVQSERATLCWLAQRVAGNALRGRRRRADHERRFQEETMTTSTDATRDPAQQAVAHERHDLVQRRVAELPDELRLPLEMHCQDELTLASVGAALRLPTSTVHDRVRRALERLRRALEERGLAVSATALPALVQQIAPVAPFGLEAHLLRTGGAALLAAVDTTRRLVVVCLATLAVAGVAVGVLASGSGDPDRPRGTTAYAQGAAAAASGGAAARGTGPGSRPPSVREPAAVAVSVDQPNELQDPQPALPRSLSGSVHDAARWPVVGVQVTLLAAGGFKGLALGRATTDHQGRFTIRSRRRLRTLRPELVRFEVVEAGVRLLRTEQRSLAAAAAAPVELVLPEQVGVATERFEHRVSVTDPQGAALAAVPVTLYRDPLPVAGRPGGVREAVAMTDAGGVATLRGRRGGRKWLLVDGRERGYGYRFEAIEAGGSDEVALSRAGSLMVRCRDLHGEPLGQGQAWLFDEALGLHVQGEQLPDGGVRFTGLGDRSYQLHVGGGMRHSPALLRDVQAGARELVVRLKPRSSTDDVGDHMAEVHGAVFDAVSGDEVPLWDHAIEVLELRAGSESTSPFDRIVPPRPVQRMTSDRTQIGFHQVGLRPGRYAIVVGVPGYARAAHEIVVTEGQIIAGLRIPVHRGAVVAGRVLDGSGESVRSALVVPVGHGPAADEIVRRWRARRDRDQPEPQLPPCRIRTDERGVFELGRVPPGQRLRLLVIAGELATLRDVGVLQAGERVELADLHLQR